ncbi:MAG TPA: ABC transporter permease [Vicinamibacterales bacterium]|jgi:ABC-2 type transport system permease protein
MAIFAARTGGVFRVTKREFGRIFASWYYLILLVVLPIASFAILWTIFGDGVPRDLPLAVVDQDHSALSRQLTRMVDATPSLSVAVQVPDLEAARSLILRNKVYGFIVIPSDMERDVRRGEAPAVVAYYNAQLLLPASLIRRDLRMAVGTLSAVAELKVREAHGEPPRAAMAHLEPIRLDYHTLFNPQLSYLYYLVAALLPTMLQIFVTVGTVHALGVELKEGTAGAWMEAAGGSAWRAVVGKLLPYTAHFSVLSLFMLVVLFRYMGVPMRGSMQVIVAGTLLFVLAYQAVALLVVAWIANLRFATSVAAFYCTPAFAFVGITFPTMAMPVLGRVWGAVLPLTHYLKILVDQAMRGTAPANSMASLGALLVFVCVAPLISVWRMGEVARDPRHWGRL